MIKTSIDINILQQELREFEIGCSDLNMPPKEVIEKYLDEADSYTAGYVLISKHTPLIIASKNVTYLNNILFFDNAEIKLFTYSQYNICDCDFDGEFAISEVEKEFIFIAIRDHIRYEDLYRDFDEMYFNTLSYMNQKAQTQKVDSAVGKSKDIPNEKKDSNNKIFMI